MIPPPPPEDFLPIVLRCPSCFRRLRAFVPLAWPVRVPLPARCRLCDAWRKVKLSEVTTKETTTTTTTAAATEATTTATRTTAAAAAEKRETDGTAKVGAEALVSDWPISQWAAELEEAAAVANEE